MQFVPDYTHQNLIQTHKEDRFAAWAHSMHMDTAVAVVAVHLDHMVDLIAWDLDKTYLLVDQALEDHMTGEGVPVMAFQMMAACHIAAVHHSLVGCQPADKLAVNFHTHKDTWVHRIHARSSGEKGLPGDRELDAHNLDHGTVHSCNLPGMEVHP